MADIIKSDSCIGALITELDTLAKIGDQLECLIKSQESEVEAETFHNDALELFGMSMLSPNFSAYSRRIGKEIADNKQILKEIDSILDLADGAIGAVLGALDFNDVELRLLGQLAKGIDEATCPYSYASQATADKDAAAKGETLNERLERKLNSIVNSIDDLDLYGVNIVTTFDTSCSDICYVSELATRVKSLRPRVDVFIDGVPFEVNREIKDGPVADGEDRVDTGQHCFLELEGETEEEVLGEIDKYVANLDFGDMGAPSRTVITPVEHMEGATEYLIDALLDRFPNIVVECENREYTATLEEPELHRLRGSSIVGVELSKDQAAALKALFG